MALFTRQVPVSLDEVTDPAAMGIDLTLSNDPSPVARWLRVGQHLLQRLPMESFF